MALLVMLLRVLFGTHGYFFLCSSCLYSADIERKNGDLYRATAETIPIAVSFGTDFLLKKGSLVSPAFSNASGVFAGFYTQYLISSDYMRESTANECKK